MRDVIFACLFPLLLRGELCIRDERQNTPNIFLLCSPRFLFFVFFIHVLSSFHGVKKEHQAEENNKVIHGLSYNKQFSQILIILRIKKE